MTDPADTIRREAIEYERRTRNWTPDLWREDTPEGEHWPARIAQVRREADEAVDALLAERQQAQEDAKEWKEAFEAAVVQRRQAIDALREWTDWALSGIAAPVDDPVHSLTERSVELLVQLGEEKP